jgi:hypothetical protein
LYTPHNGQGGDHTQDEEVLKIFFHEIFLLVEEDTALPQNRRFMAE